MLNRARWAYATLSKFTSSAVILARRPTCPQLWSLEVRSGADGLLSQLRGDVPRDRAHVARQGTRGGAIELIAEPDGGDRMRDRASEVQHRHRHDGHAGDVVAAIDAESLAAHQIDLLAPGVVGRRVVPAQQAEALLDLRPGLATERGDATAGRADQGGKAAADIDMQA